MIKACKKEKNIILEFLKKDIANALYMYIDIKKYGTENSNIDVWYDNIENLSSIVMRYHNSITVYSKDKLLDYHEVLSIAKNNNISVINGNHEAISAFSDYLNRHLDNIGYVFKLKISDDYYSNIKIEKPIKNDFKEIAKLICEDKSFGKLYNESDIENQLLTRINDGFGRSYIIREGKDIIGHIATYAEFDKIAITSGLVVSKKYQNGLYGAALENYLINTLIDEGFEVYTFVTNKIRKKYLEINNNKLVGYYSRILL